MLNNSSENLIFKKFLITIMSDFKKNNIIDIFFKTLFLLIIIFICFYFFLLKVDDQPIEHVAIVHIDGPIEDKGKFSAKNIIYNLNSAFFNKYAKIIIIRINSAGGSPVQSNIIYNHIKRLRKISSKPIYSVIEDIGTSGAYLIALATEKIYCNQVSIVGSIGVIVTSFGCVEAMKKLGIERRIYKSGKNKILMDPFFERNEESDEIIQNNVNIINKYFINIVKKNRQNKLNHTNDIFSGRFWLGKDALKLGFVDGFYDIYTLVYDIIKITNIIDYDLCDDSSFFNFLINR